MTSRPFAGRGVVVTGGAEGLGRGIAEAFVAAGARVMIAGRDHAKTAAAAAMMGNANFAAQADVSAPEQCEKLIVEAFVRLGNVDVLVNNAAMFALGDLIDADPGMASAFFATNALGPLHCARAFAKRKIAQNMPGTVINVSSIASARAAAGCGLYGASKAALDALTRAMAVEWAPRGIRVNAVAPGHIETSGVLSDFAAGRLDREAMTARIPVRKIATPKDVADVVLFLAGDDSRHIIGQIVTVDGGEGF